MSGSVPSSRMWIGRIEAVSVIIALVTIISNVVVVYGPPIWTPVIACDQSEWDAGIVDQWEDLHHTFNLRNSGWRPLTIVRIESDCGCTKVAPTDFPRTIGAGESLSISCQVKLKAVSGTFKKRLIVLSDDPQHPQFPLAVSGKAIGVK